MVSAAHLGQDTRSSRISMLYACVHRVGTELTNQPLMNLGGQIGSERPLSEGLTVGVFFDFCEARHYFSNLRRLPSPCCLNPANFFPP